MNEELSSPTLWTISMRKVSSQWLLLLLARAQSRAEMLSRYLYTWRQGADPPQQTGSWSERITNDCCSKPLGIGIRRPHIGRCLKAESPLQMLNMVPTDWPLFVKEIFLLKVSDLFGIFSSNQVLLLSLGHHRWSNKVWFVVVVVVV